MKKFYSIFAAALLCSTTAFAQYHGVKIDITDALINSGQNNTDCGVLSPSGKAIQVWLEGLYMPEYQYPKSSTEIGNCYGGKNNTTDYTNPKNIQANLEAGTINGYALTTAEANAAWTKQELRHEAGMCLATVPSQAYIDGALVDCPQGDLRIRIGFGTGGNRPGDWEGAKDSGMYLIDSKGVAASLLAPSHVSVKCTYVAANGTTDFGDGLGAYFHNVVYAMPTMDGTIKGVKSAETPEYGAGYFTYQPDAWPNGFAVKYLDIIFYGVKAGDLVGFGDYQTIHDGYTPVFTEHNLAGVKTVVADENAPAEYFNLQGVRVENPTAGLYIKRQGAKASKVLVK